MFSKLIRNSSSQAIASIQVVGRLVEQQDVRVSEQRLGKQHLYLLGAGQGAHLGVVKGPSRFEAV